MRVNDPSSATVEVDERTIGLTHLDRVVYPETGTTKAQVLSHYLAVADVMIPYLADRPITRRKWPDGVTGEVFYEKNLPTWAPEWLPRVELAHSDRTVTYPLVRTRADLLWLAQSGALELHVPQWRMNAEGSRGAPDRLVLDLDPGDPAGLAECASVALWLRDRLAADGAVSRPVTSGSKGLQVYASWPVPGAGTDDTREYARTLAGELARAFPDGVVASMTKAERTGKVLVDWSQNNPAKTTIAPYSLRGRATPTAAAPRLWSDLTSPELAQLRSEELIAQIAAIGDPGF